MTTTVKAERVDAARRERLEREAASAEAERAWRERKVRETRRRYLTGLEEAMERSDVTPTLLAEQIRVARETINGYAKLKNRASAQMTKALAETMGVDPEELTKP